MFSAVSGSRRYSICFHVIEISEKPNSYLRLVVMAKDPTQKNGTKCVDRNSPLPRHKWRPLLAVNSARSSIETEETLPGARNHVLSGTTTRYRLRTDSLIDPRQSRKKLSPLHCASLRRWIPIALRKWCKVNSAPAGDLLIPEHIQKCGV